jgi:virginiamycin B lyase
MVAVGPGGTVWFTEAHGDGIGRLDPRTGHIREYHAGITPGSKPVGITVDRDGTVWFTSLKLAGLGRLDPRTGRVTDHRVGAPAIDGIPFAVVTGPDHRIWYAQQGGTHVVAFDPRIGTYRSIQLTGDARASTGLVVGPDGAIWFDQTCVPGALGRIDPSTMALDVYGTSPSLFSYGLSVAPDGHLWFADGGGPLVEARGIPTTHLRRAWWRT